MKTNEKEKFYGAHLTHMETVKDKAVIIAKFAAEFSGAKTSRIVSRIKSPESMEKKILADSLPVNYHSMLVEESDAIGIRIITDSISDVYKISDNLVKSTISVIRNVRFCISRITSKTQSPVDIAACTSF